MKVPINWWRNVVHCRAEPPCIYEVPQPWRGLWMKLLSVSAAAFAHGVVAHGDAQKMRVSDQPGWICI